MKPEEGEAKAKEHDILFTEVSAKVGHNVANLFKTLATHLAGNETAANTTANPSGNQEPAQGTLNRNVYFILFSFAATFGLKDLNAPGNQEEGKKGGCAC